MTARQVAWRAFGLGIVSGGRSTAAIAALAATTPADASLGRQPLTAMTGTVGTRVAALLLLGELIADKLPSTPSRLTPPVLMARVVTGGLSAYVLAQRQDEPPALPVAAGAVGAVVGSVVGLRWRDAAARRVSRDLPAALLEDLVVLGLAAAAARPS